MFVTTKEAAKLTGLSEYTLRLGFKAGEFPALEVGRGSRRRSLRWDIEALHAVLEARMAERLDDHHAAG